LENVYVFYGHLEYLTVIWYILWSFGTFCDHLAYIFPFWYHVPRKIWQPWSERVDGDKIWAGLSFQVRSVERFCTCAEKCFRKKWLTKMVHLFPEDEMGLRGRQMVNFQTKNPNLGKFRRALEWKSLVNAMANLNF
jgi:hypothetical protein